ncbi:MAG: hypothetical protein GX245_03195 [Eubacteriaceae bacterium]|jgi:hypothetical protein|nr:hypothetical protein [Eubacteriaceae bacterium]
MTKKNKTASMLSLALIGNIFYYILCAILFQLSPVSKAVYILFFICSILLWFGIGAYYGTCARKTNIGKQFIFALVTMIPILLFFITYVVLTRLQSSTTGNPWLLFYTFGAPLLFWLKPATFLLHSFNISFPLFAAGYILLLLLTTFAGAALFALKQHKETLLLNESEEIPEKDIGIPADDSLQNVPEVAEPFENEVPQKTATLSQEDTKTAEEERQDILRFIKDTNNAEDMTGAENVIEQQYEESQYRIDGQGDTYKTMPMPTIDELYAEVLSQKDLEPEDEAALYMQEIITDMHFVAEYELTDESVTEQETAESIVDDTASSSQATNLFQEESADKTDATSTDSAENHPEISSPEQKEDDADNS